MDNPDAITVLSREEGVLFIDADAGKIIDINHYLIDLLGYQRNIFFEKFGIWNFLQSFLIK
jgi:two-component system CheB/CheR fusion protein